MTPSQIGALVGVGFAALWAAAGLSVLRRKSRTALASVFAVVVIALIVAVFRVEPDEGGGRFGGGIYGITVGGEMIAIVAAVRLLTRYRREAMIPPVVASLVGLHFIGLWAATGATVFPWVAAAGLCAVAAFGMFVAHRQGASRALAVTGLGSAAVLCLATAAGLRYR